MKHENEKKTCMTYKDSGVDIHKGEALVEKIKLKVRNTYGPEVVSGVGGFCSLYDMGNGRYLAAGTDGVGTKMKLAQTLNIHHTVGIDLVAMSANDVLCCGARPLFFLDYFSCGTLDLGVSDAVLSGIVQGCQEAQMPLVGGETAEMPGLYQQGEYDLAGFCVGEVEKEKVLDGRKVAAGDVILGLSSSGFHSNGFSLVRNLVDDSERDLMEKCLTPTRLYVRPLLKVMEKIPQGLKGLAHITGGGLRNILRINPSWGYRLTSLPSLEELPPFMSQVLRRSSLTGEELYTTFNMGIGLALIVDPKEAVATQTLLRELGEEARVLGEVTADTGKVLFMYEGKEIILN